MSVGSTDTAESAKIGLGEVVRTAADGVDS
jgi:hypothetical protein